MDKRAYAHFSLRAKERFGAFLSERLVEQLEDCIRQGFYYKICDQGVDVSLYRVPMGMKTAAVAYNRVKRTVLTIMPIEWTSRAWKIERELAESRAADAEVE